MTAVTSAGYNPYDPGVLKDPYPYYTCMREQTPVLRSPLGSASWMITDADDDLPVFVVTGYRELAFVLENADLFTSEDKGGPAPPPEVQKELEAGYAIMPTLYSIDPPEHTRRRRLSQSAMSADRVAATEPATRAVAEEQVASIVQGGSADLFAEFCSPFIKAAMLDFIGIPRADHVQISAWNQSFQEVCIPGSTTGDPREAAREVVAYQRYFDRVIGERRTCPRGDLLGLLAEARNAPSCPMSDGELAWGMMDLIGAGYGNTAEGLANVLHLLLVEHSRWAALVADRSLVGAAVEEGLRLESPVHWLPRKTTREVELGGVILPADSSVICNFSAANRDPVAFPDPDEFDMGRAGSGPFGRHLAMGRGVHYCLGALWARSALRVGVETLLDRLPGLRLNAGYDIGYSSPAPMIRVVSHIPAVWDRPAPDTRKDPAPSSAAGTVSEGLHHVR